MFLRNRLPHPIEVKLGDTNGRIPKGIVAFLRRYPNVKSAHILHGGNSQTLRKNGVDFHFANFKEASMIADVILQDLTS